MSVQDQQGYALSGATHAAAESYEQALTAFHCYAGDAPGAVQSALTDSPHFTMAHILLAYLTLIGTNAELTEVGLQALAAARQCPTNERERGHLAALGAMTEGRYRDAARIYDEHAERYPLDSVALQIAQLVDYVRGDQTALRARVARAQPAWSTDRPHYHSVLGMMAFGHEENAAYAEAEACGKDTLALERRNGWAWHAVAHVFEMQGRAKDGIAWLRSDVPAWPEESFFQVHNWWHLALYHLRRGEIDAVLDLYDGPIGGGTSNLAVDLIDASALLWRLHLRGIDVRSRFEQLATLYAQAPQGLLAFDDLHAAMTFVGAGRSDLLRTLRDAQHTVAPASGDNAAVVLRVGLDILDGLAAYGDGQYDRSDRLLRKALPETIAIGGSNAQRDAFTATLDAAHRRAGMPTLQAA